MDAISANESKRRRRTENYNLFRSSCFGTGKKKADKSSTHPARAQAYEHQMQCSHRPHYHQTNKRGAKKRERYRVYGLGGGGGGVHESAGEKNSSITLIVCTGRNRIAMCLSTNQMQRKREK